MKRSIAIVLIITATAGVGWLGSEALETVQERRTAVANRLHLPNIELLDIDGTKTTLASVPPHTTVLVFFVTTCNFCRQEIEEFKAYAPAFDEASVFLISPELPEPLRQFREETGLSDFPQYGILRDFELSLGQLFGISRVPTVLVYNREGVLVRQFEALADVRSIISALEDA